MRFDRAMTIRRLILAALIGVGAVTTVSALGSNPPAAAQDEKKGKPPTPAKPPVFDADIQPIFQAKCVRCHGEKEPKAKLDLRSYASVMKGGESGEVVVPGKPKASLLYENVRDGTMPADKEDPLTDDEVQTVRRWIEAGARRAAEKPDKPKR